MQVEAARRWLPPVSVQRRVGCGTGMAAARCWLADAITVQRRPASARGPSQTGRPAPGVLAAPMRPRAPSAAHPTPGGTAQIASKGVAPAGHGGWQLSVCWRLPLTPAISSHTRQSADLEGAQRSQRGFHARPHAWQGVQLRRDRGTQHLQTGAVCHDGRQRRRRVRVGQLARKGQGAQAREVRWQALHLGACKAVARRSGVAS